MGPRTRSDLTLADIALAYELREEGCCWKRIASGLGCGEIEIKEAVGHAVRHGIRKGLDGYARISGRAAGLDIRVIKSADQMRKTTKFSWRAVGNALSVDPERLRMAHRYAAKAGLL